MRYTSSLKGNVNFKRVIKQGQYLSGKDICVYIKKNKLNEDKNLLGICVSKKHGNSVVRNKLKRWVREGYYSCENNIKRNFSIVILFRKNIDIKKINYWSVKEEITDLFRKSELIVDEK